MTVLEPSAGMACWLRRRALPGPRSMRWSWLLTCARYCRRKGLVWWGDLGHHPAQSYDAVVMNPPFSMTWILTMYAMLMTTSKAGGRLVAIVSATAGSPKQQEQSLP